MSINGVSDHELVVKVMKSWVDQKTGNDHSAASFGWSSSFIEDEHKKVIEPNWFLFPKCPCKRTGCWNFHCISGQWIVLRNIILNQSTFQNSFGKFSQIPSIVQPTLRSCFVRNSSTAPTDSLTSKLPKCINFKATKASPTKVNQTHGEKIAGWWWSTTKANSVKIYGICFFRFRLKLIIVRQRFHPKKLKICSTKHWKFIYINRQLTMLVTLTLKIGYDDISWSMLTNPTLDDNLWNWGQDVGHRWRHFTFCWESWQVDRQLVCSVNFNLSITTSRINLHKMNKKPKMLSTFYRVCTKWNKESHTWPAGLSCWLLVANRRRKSSTSEN